MTQETAPVGEDRMQDTREIGDWKDCNGVNEELEKEHDTRVG